MSTGRELDIKQTIGSTAAVGPREIAEITAAIAANYSRYGDLRDAVQELENQPSRSPAMSAKLGVCLYLLGRYTAAIDVLSKADGGALTHFYLGKSHLALDQYAEAETAYESSAKAGYDKGVVALAIAEAKRYQGDSETALTLLDDLSGAVEQTSD